MARVDSSSPAFVVQGRRSKDERSRILHILKTVVPCCIHVAGGPSYGHLSTRVQGACGCFRVVFRGVVERVRGVCPCVSC